MADENYDDLYNSDVIDVDGEKVGAVGQVYLDDSTGKPTWVTVKTGLFGTKETFVPLLDATFGDGTVTVGYTEDFIKDAPAVDPDRHLDASEEAELYRYYGIATAVVEQADEVDAETEVIVEETGPLGDEPVVEAPNPS